MKNSWIVRKATHKDARCIAGIGRETFYETWRAVNTEEDMQLYMAKAFAEEVIAADLANGQNTFLLIASDGREAGYAKMRRDRTHPVFNTDKAIEIERIYVRKEFQGMKFGKALMDECISIANAEDNTWLWLGVNIDNEKAVRFYKKYGFTIFGTKQFKLGDAVDDDYLMKMNLKEPR